MAKGYWFMSGHRGCLISVAGHDYSPETWWPKHERLNCRVKPEGTGRGVDAVMPVWKRQCDCSNSAHMITSSWICRREASNIRSQMSVCIRAEWDTFVCLHADAVTALRADLLPFPWSGVRLNQSSCVYSLFLRLRNPTEKGGRSMTAMEKEQWRHLLMIQRTGPHHGEKVRMSHFPLSLSITSSLGPSKGGNQQMPCQESVVQLPFRCSTSAVYENSAESNLTLSNGRRSEFPLWDTGTSWETTAI